MLFEPVVENFGFFASGYLVTLVLFVASFVVAIAIGMVVASARAGVLSVGARQLEAARSLGLTQLQALRYVVLPQALRSVIPPLGNLAIALVKNTAVASAIPAADLLYQADIIASRTFRLDPYLAAILGYLSL